MVFYGMAQAATQEAVAEGGDNGEGGVCGRKVVDRSSRKEKSTEGGAVVTGTLCTGRANPGGRGFAVEHRLLCEGERFVLLLSGARLSNPQKQPQGK